jgi:hypothetical protein
LNVYEGISKSFRTGRQKRELQMVQLSATTSNRIAILWVSLVFFAAITFCVAHQRVFIVVSVYFFVDSVRKLSDTPSYILKRDIFHCLISTPSPSFSPRSSIVYLWFHVEWPGQYLRLASTQSLVLYPPFVGVFRYN